MQESVVADDSSSPEPGYGPYLDEASKKALKARLARIEGHVRSISRMVDEREWADEILLQTAAVKGAINRFAAVLVEDELRSCLQCCPDPAAQEERIDRLTKVLSTLFKQS
jgi:CsoR family transcriptional regulator, copper-sensing transcriptional repressor